MVATNPIRQKKHVILSVAKDPRILFGAPRLSQTPAIPTPATKPEPCTLGPESSPTSGFTLLELMIVMVVIGLLAAIAIPAYTSNIRNAKEAVLKEDLHTMRQAIDSYTVDKAKAPQSLDDLVQAGYLKSMPVDPFTHRSDTWLPVQEDTNISLDQTETGIDDVHSGAQQTASDGTSYNTW
ncbi:type II secretion system protein [Tunturibacter empetritectus]|uniref:General secretion pathway protein G n=1 Tax=Tunturiibacter lichenicola TaxID=2051959 RepID=A0A7W8JDG0_9BACT|nr:prepilin-type N-terminal cleavage/methylation domain-containing protein [Edaphobacter lichenicola]MBB5345996.1 general secretion pathway protein G [Edaphobacter lichenicola]